jgi:hypothetical protein
MPMEAGRPPGDGRGGRRDVAAGRWPLGVVGQTFDMF